MARLFGFSIEDAEKTPAGVISPVPPNNQDGSEYYVSSGFYGSYVDIEGVYRTENDLLRNWYVDGRLYYNKVIDQKNPHEGIQELRYIDAAKMRFIRQMKKDKNTGNGNLAREDITAYDYPEIEEYFFDL